MSTPPLVSIAMPVRNGLRTLALAVQSILDQTYPHWELWIMDDGSTDGTPDLARSFGDPRIQVRADGCGRGISARLNQVLDLAHGSLYARMDADDVAYPQRLAQQVAYLAVHPTVDLVGAWVVVFNEAGRAVGKRTGPQAHAGICARPYAGFPVGHPTFLGRLAWFRRYRYDEQITYSQDQDLFLRAYRTSTLANVPEILLGYREQALRLGKTLTGRREFAGSLLREMRHGHFYIGARGLLEHSLKAGFEVVATQTALAPYLLRHRAMPLTAGERAAWARVRQAVSRGREEAWHG
jgi:glycosyltransferase involved in cell wall biosynthesis